MEEKNSLLRVQNIELSFGSNRVLKDVSFDVHENSIHSIIGPNGAGKTSLLNCISGFYRPQSGKVMYEGNDLTKTATTKIAQLGVAVHSRILPFIRG